MIKAHDATITRIKTLKGYTAQARYYASHMLNDASGDAFVCLGWTRLAPQTGYLGAPVKPVYQTLAGQRVILMDGDHHLTVYVCELDKDAEIRPTDLDWYPNGSKF